MSALTQRHSDIADLTIVPNRLPYKVYVRNQKWMGDRYDAIFEANGATQIMRNGLLLPCLNGGKTWVAHKTENHVAFEAK